MNALMLAAVMVSASLTQFLLGALGPFLLAEFRLEPSALGLLTACYYLAAAGLSPLMGRLVAALGGVGGMLLSAGLGAAGTALLAGSTGLGWLIAGLLIAGAAAAAANPATNLVIVALPRPHGSLIGIKQSGVQAAAFLTGALLPAVALGLGWRAAVLCCTGGCLLALALVLTRRAALGAGRPARRGADARPGRAARRPWLTPLTGYAALMGAGAASVNTYLVVYGHQRLGLDIRVAGAQFALVGLVAVVARICLPLVADRSPGPAVRGLAMLRDLACGATVAALVIAGAPGAGPWALWVGAVLAGLSSASWNGIAMLVVVHDSRPDAVPAASARVQGAFFLGLMLSPLVFGGLLAGFGSYLAGWLWTAGCFLAAIPLAHRALTRTRAAG
ncbi:MFS transporter [Streptomyces profundus]|uniref:MFS transporter n=1 Tax=Streptomyces profundus TaxID=2867410 RepID=UPI001D16EE28|nr:MFS transporter [Streptomyces sp. MA3_2.13]UED87499.1 MFS transporter [Streptomyces sp. MA3_2.13]